MVGAALWLEELEPDAEAELAWLEAADEDEPEAEAAWLEADEAEAEAELAWLDAEPEADEADADPLCEPVEEAPEADEPDPEAVDTAPEMCEAMSLVMLATALQALEASSAARTPAKGARSKRVETRMVVEAWGKVF